MVCYGGKYLLIFGGSNGKNKFNDLLRINVEDCSLLIVKGDGDVPTARFGHTAEVNKSCMYVFGGWNGVDTLDELFTYSFSSNLWYEERLTSG